MDYGSDTIEDKAWIAELESALKDEQVDEEEDAFLSDALRPEIWKSCLNVELKSFNFDEIFDLPEQNVIRKDCQQFVAKLGNDDEDKVSVLSDLECLLTYHRKSMNIPYKSGNGWIELLIPLIALKLPRSETYILFDAIVSKYIPRGPAIYHLFRLILLYHEPSLYSFLDTKRITPEHYASTWFQSLFAGECSLPATTLLWDLYFQQSDPFFLLFLGLVLIINARDSILTLKDKPKDVIIETIISLPSALQATDIQDFCSLAQNFSNTTPGSFRQDLERCLFDDENCPEDTKAISQALCLPVNVSELVENIFLFREKDSLKFFLVDCRPAEQYNAGHIPTAFHLDCDLMLQAGDVYKMAVQGLLSAQKQALDAGSTAGGEHLCFMGCGNLEQDQYTHMVVASFLRDSAQYVSILNGGYNALHNYFGDSVDNTLLDHNEACLVCLSKTTITKPVLNKKEETQSQSKDIFEKIGAVVKSKSAEVKGKLLEYIVNPNNDTERHVKPSDRKNKKYRNMASVFSIDDDQDPQDIGYYETTEPDLSEFEEVSLSAWKARRDITAKFECTYININKKQHKSELMLSHTHIYVLRHTNRTDVAKLIVKRPLEDIVSVTRKRKFPHLFTLKYGRKNEMNQIEITDMDSFHIPKSDEATKCFQYQVEQLRREKEEKDNSNVKEDE